MGTGQIGNQLLFVNTIGVVEVRYSSGEGKNLLCRRFRVELDQEVGDVLLNTQILHLEQTLPECIEVIFSIGLLLETQSTSVEEPRSKVDWLL